MKGNREKRKDDRRANILRAAEDLIRETGSTDFSMNNLASRAGVSTPTPYNLLGSKAAILYSLLHRFQDRLDVQRGASHDTGSAIGDVLRSADEAADVYTADGEFVRPLMLFLLGVNESDHRSAFMERGFQYWWLSMSPLDARLSNAGISRRLMAREMLVLFTGLFDFWVNHEIEDEDFRASARYGTALKLLPIADAAERQYLIDEMKRVEPKLAAPYRVP